MHESEYAPTHSPFEAMLVELHAAVAAGDAEREAELREQIKADLAARERALGLSWPPAWHAPHPAEAADV